MNSDSEIYRVLGRLESKVDSLLDENHRFESVIKETVSRVSKLEHDRALVFGAAAVLGIIGSAVIWVISKIMSTQNKSVKLNIFSLSFSSIFILFCMSFAMRINPSLSIAICNLIRVANFLLIGILLLCYSNLIFNKIRPANRKQFITPV